MTKPTRSLWPYAIIAWFSVFIACLVAFIVFTLRQRDDLVRSDYYEAEVRYQRHIDRASRGQTVSREVAIAYEAAAQRVTIQLPRSQAHLHPSGRINFYRPSDASLDHAIPLIPDANGMHQLDASHLRPGLWNVHLYWTVNDQEFYFDQSIVVAPKQSAAGPLRFDSNSSSSASAYLVERGPLCRFRPTRSILDVRGWMFDVSLT